MLLITLNENTLSLSPGSQVIFPHQTWEDYERLLSLRLQKTYPKLCFNRKTQEIRLMSPLPSHGKRINLLSDLVKIILRRQGKDWECFDPITLKIPGEAGVEPDTCFYIDNREAILGKERIDLTVDPPPDLAIEVDFTSLTDVEAYQLLKIPELWVYRREELKIYLFREDGYQESENSRLFPDINIKKLLPYYVELGWNQGSSLALRQFEALENFS
ncbi:MULTISPECIES: Uma2 family endonuclease [unclassified Microcystis]|jgi:Uma2 family endonuclease|uniref:Uma2 family endonuclease n=1 Tax=unclassified Microcystis TaxID=2643300 RepID=UPI0022CA4D33|nr:MULTISPECIES: Uma2 family endonuclease [unclassified Microcystis]MCA2691650.1 Uma2 family endonuclease [Microcystis sp. M034S2]MCA2752194.1 Uma2 family endonuclease [Microcystis sp. M144S2]MCZ8201261.1 Uma2 family endonuclease [Microcystis sp. LE19-55.1A]MCZ8306422.1 Uma2 family endonuclease [Microcystis sp. LE19-98.1E]